MTFIFSIINSWTSLLVLSHMEALSCMSHSIPLNPFLLESFPIVVSFLHGVLTGKSFFYMYINVLSSAGVFEPTPYFTHNAWVWNSDKSQAQTEGLASYPGLPFPLAIPHYFPLTGTCNGLACSVVNCNLMSGIPSAAYGEINILYDFILFSYHEFMSMNKTFL
jgi:hypothetical protein